MKNYIVIGCGRFGFSIAKTLFELGHDVLAVDSNMDKIQEISDHVTEAIQLDVTDDKALQSVGLKNFDAAIVTITSDFEAAIMATLIVKESHIATVICKARTDLQAQVFQKLGANRIVFPERDMGVRVAHQLASPNILEFFSFDRDFSIAEIKCPEAWVGKSLKEIDMRAKYGLNTIGIKTEGTEDINFSPDVDERLTRSHVLLLVGKEEKIIRLSNQLS